MPEAIWLKLCGHGWSVQNGVVALLGFGGWDVPVWLQDRPVVEPVDPFEGCVFHGLEAAPWTTTVDNLGLEQAVDRLGQCVVVLSPTLPTDDSIPASAGGIWPAAGFVDIEIKCLAEL